jgi:hypothetical protein
MLDGEGAPWRRLLANEDAALLADRTWLAGGFGAAWNEARARLLVTPRPVFPLEGRDALAMGALPGPDIGKALRRTRAWWMEQGCLPDREACLERFKAEELGGAQPPPPDPPSPI